jgi:hypothetical protein
VTDRQVAGSISYLSKLDKDSAHNRFSHIGFARIRRVLSFRNGIAKPGHVTGHRILRFSAKPAARK